MRITALLVLTMFLMMGCRGSNALRNIGAMEEGYQQSRAAGGYAPQRAPAQIQQQEASRDCYSNVDCPIGLRCMRPGGYGPGQCGRPVDSYGVPTYDYDAQPAACTLSMDCPVGFECRKPGGRFEGVCVKR